MAQLQTQAEANAYWADKPYKKYVVNFSMGSGRSRKTAVAYVGAETTTGARRAAIAAMKLMGKPWAQGALATVRLATAQDLGCTRTDPGSRNLS